MYWHLMLTPCCAIQSSRFATYCHHLHGSDIIQCESNHAGSIHDGIVLRCVLFVIKLVLSLFGLPFVGDDFLVLILILRFTVRATLSASRPFATLPLFFTLFGFRFTSGWLWSKPSPTPSPLSLFRSPSFLSPPLIPVFAPCSSHRCAPRCHVRLVPCAPVYSWFCCINCLGHWGFGHAGPSHLNYIVSS
jgi:hypothetical protein